MLVQEKNPEFKWKLCALQAEEDVESVAESEADFEH